MTNVRTGCWLGFDMTCPEMQTQKNPAWPRRVLRVAWVILATAMP